MAAAGGAASIITQVQQTGGPPINSLGGAYVLSLAKAAISLRFLTNLGTVFGADFKKQMLVLMSR
jgi:hypothetical protein